ncbi:hypothetical protein AYO44_03045 [Planctomycetaceae bacterium SCGC AG-212-F19]|nr:hypothetical protein AYO44_03045 [Planctomycetaceae bacterium SCGC AG-212-F19]
MVEGATEEAGRAGLEVLVKRAPYLRMGEAFQQMYQRNRLGGVIYASHGGEKLLRRLAGLNVPTVLLGDDLYLPRLNSVRDDAFAGARQAVRHLGALGHRHIAFAYREFPDMRSCRQRGFRQGLRELGLPRRCKWEIPADHSPEGVSHVVEELLRLAPRPTGLYCSDNHLARAIRAELGQHGVSVPGDMSILGGGGEDVPGLTCHQADWYQMGRLAVQILLRALTEPNRHTPEHHVLLNVLQSGSSTMSRLLVNV